MNTDSISTFLDSFPQLEAFTEKSSSPFYCNAGYGRICCYEFSVYFYFTKTGLTFFVYSRYGNNRMYIPATEFESIGFEDGMNVILVRTKDRDILFNLSDIQQSSFEVLGC